MHVLSAAPRRPRILVFLALLALSACDAADSPDAGPEPVDAGPPARYALASVVILPNGDRTTYIQPLTELGGGPYGTSNAFELPGNGVIIGGGGAVFVGLAEEPTWIRLDVVDGRLVETNRLNLLNVGATRIDFGNAYVDDTTAVSVFGQLGTAVVWNPTTMEIVREIPLPHLSVADFTAENFTTVAHDGLVYIPGRWGDFIRRRIRPGVSVTIVDPSDGTVVAIAEDDRCTSGGQVVFDDEGYAYVMGDGRNFITHSIAELTGTTALDNCLLRIPPGGTEFDPDYYYAIPALSGGLQSITELDTPAQGLGVAFSKMFDPALLPDGVTATDFDFWDLPVHRLWRLTLADPPTAEPVEGAPLAAIGFGAAGLDGMLIIGENERGGDSEVFAVDPATNVATRIFSMTGYFNGIFSLTR